MAAGAGLQGRGPCRPASLRRPIFVALPAELVARIVGVVVLGVVALRHTPKGGRPVPEGLLAPAGPVVGFVSGVAGMPGLWGRWSS